MTTTQPAPVQTYAINAGKIARIETIEAWLNYAKQPDLAAQDASTRTPIKIGIFTTYWSKGLAPDSPPFIGTVTRGVRHLLVLLETIPAVVVFENIGRIWERRATLTRTSEMLAALPIRAFAETPETKPASENQLNALRKFLDVSPAQAYPALSAMACSRLLDRLIIERALAKLREDLALCAQASPACTPNLLPE